MSEAGMGLRGRNGIFSLISQCLTEPAEGERPVTMLLGPRGSGASEAHYAVMEKFGADTPCAYLNFDADQVLLPRYALALLARQLERQWSQYRLSRFPRLTLALIASDDELQMSSRAEGRRAIQVQLNQFWQRAEERYGDYFGAFLTVAGNAMGIPGGTPEVVSVAVRDVARRGMRRLPGKKITDGSQWFAHHPLVRFDNPWDALLELNIWRHSGTEDQQKTLDRVLFSAFLADLNGNTERWWSPRSYLILLDNCHTEQGRRFLQLLLAARRDIMMANAPHDPLTVVGSANRWLDDWGSSTGAQWQWQPRDPDHASLADWREHRPGQDSTDFWWYPLRLRDLTLDEVRTRVELSAPRHADLAPFVHRLTCGLPAAVQQVTSTLDSAGVTPGRGAERDQWLRGLPDRELRGAEGARSLLATALGPLLAGLSPERQATLTDCAAAHDLVVASRVLGAPALESTGESLFNEVRARWLLHHPRGASAPGLHPWLRRLLLWRLAEDATRWDRAHRRLSEHYTNEGHTVHRLYHRLATHHVGPSSEPPPAEKPIDEVVRYLVEALPALSTARWLDEFNVITSAPNRLPMDRSPVDLLADLIPEEPDMSVTAPSVIRGLVLARWVWSDPLGDPGMRLNDVIASKFIQLSELRGSDIVALYDEAERYRHWRHPLTCEEGW